MPPPSFKKGPGRPKKLTWREHDETGSRMRSPGVAYRCTKCDKFGHNSRKCQSIIQDTNALKRKRKIPRTNGETSNNNNISKQSVEQAPAETAEPNLTSEPAEPTVEDPFYDP
ncbi:unnamed protein product [Lathyrus sativus]|nr:unnamed protein product [Lathyrus sativus]